ncbi:helix-turn-helix domain-containing protein [Chryseobacterium sp. 2TAF14]|uniref:helix-turn-helix domain-containing protein n=1 Tax=Chryseobacterium sp. 2TAF14 TaxID=3233007 RepID=UPI003F930969
MLTLNLTPIFKARSIEKPYTFLVKAGLSPQTAHGILHSKTRVFRLDHIELLCKILICEPCDLLLYTPDTDTILPETHPLNNLKQEDAPQKSIKESLANIPYKNLKEITKQITENNDSKTYPQK